MLFGKKIECKQSIIPHYVSFQIITVSYKLQCKVDIAQNAGKIFFLKKKKVQREHFLFSYQAVVDGSADFVGSASDSDLAHSQQASIPSLHVRHRFRDQIPLGVHGTARHWFKKTEIQKKDLTKHARSTEAEVTSYTSRALGSPVSWAGKRFDLRAAHFTWAGSWPIFVR